MRGAAHPFFQLGQQGTQAVDEKVTPRLAETCNATSPTCSVNGGQIP